MITENAWGFNSYAREVFSKIAAKQNFLYENGR